MSLLQDKDCSVKMEIDPHWLQNCNFFNDFGLEPKSVKASHRGTLEGEGTDASARV
jgi:hypothetical protein